MKRIIFLFALLVAGFSYAQELNCQVSIIKDAKLDESTLDQQIFKELEQRVFDLMNGTKWSTDDFEVEERINCNIQIQIREILVPGQTYKGWMQIQSSRPAFNSSYNTTLFNFQDQDVTFTVDRNAPFQFRRNQSNDNLIAILAFYAYYVLGMDYDSFSDEGGTKLFQQAQQIVLLEQNSGAPGWKSNEPGKNNRFWLVDNVLHELFQPLRKCNYEYHRKGLDAMYDDKVTARKSVKSALDKLMKVVATRPNSLNLLNFLQAKSTELKNMFQDAEQKEKTDVVNLLKRLDPANSSRYQQILG